MAIGIGGIEGIGAAALRQADLSLRDLLPKAASAERLIGADLAALTAATQTATHGGQPPVSPSVNTLGSVQMLVTLAALSPQEARRRDFVAFARRGLDGLERLHRELTSGQISQPTLDALTHWVQEEHPAELADSEADLEPGFSRLIEEIDLRVRVELAKFNIEA